MNRSNEAGRTEIPALEWLLGSIGALMVAGAIGFLAWSGRSTAILIPISGSRSSA